MSRWTLVALSLGLSLCSLANAATTWYFSQNPGVNLGPTVSTPVSIGSGPAIAASGFNNNFTTRDLWEKLTSGSPTNDESGLGFANEVNHEIDTHGFIVLNLSDSSFNGDSLSLYITSIQSGESYEWFHGSSLGSLATGGTNLTTSPLIFSGGGSDKYIAIEASSHNVLINSLVATSPVPEPKFYGLLLAGMLGFIIVRNRRRVTQ
jgi:hypothetical protein